MPLLVGTRDKVFVADSIFTVVENNYKKEFQYKICLPTMVMAEQIKGRHVN